MYYSAVSNKLDSQGKFQDRQSRNYKMLKKLIRSNIIDPDDSESCKGIAELLEMMFGSTKKVLSALEQAKEDEIGKSSNRIC